MKMLTFIAILPFLLIAIPLGVFADVEQLFEKVEQARIDKRSEDARAAFEELFQQDPHHVKGHVAWQNMRWSEGDEEALLEEYASYLKGTPTADAHFLLARITLDPEKREALLRQGLELDPDHLELSQQWAAFLYRQNRFEELDGAVDKLMKLTPRDLNVHLLHVETKRTAEAVAELEANYRRMIDENPDDYLPHLLLSVLLIKGTATNEALVEGELAYELAPENPDVLGGRIVISFGARFLALMNKHLEEYRQIGSAATYLSFKGLHAFLSNENPDEAIAYLSEAVRLEPLVPQHRVKHGMFLAAKGEFDESEKILQEALRIAPNEEDVLFNLGATLASQERYTEAVDVLEKLVALGSSTNPYNNLAMLYRKLGRTEDADRAEKLAKKKEEESSTDFEQQYSLDPKAAAAKLRASVAVQLAQEGQYEKAREYLRKLIADSESESPLLHHYLGTIESRGFRDEHSALKHWERAGALISDDDEEMLLLTASIAENRAWSHEALGQTEEAVAVLEAFLNQHGAQHPDHARLRQLAERLKLPRSDYDFFRLDEVHVQGTMRKDYCLPVSLATVLSHWDVDSNPRAIGRLVRERNDESGTMKAINDYLMRLEKSGIGYRYFRPNLERIKSLLKGNCPVILVGNFLFNDPPTYEAHTTVVTGYDDRTQHLILEDGNWFSGFRHLDYSFLPDMMGWLIAPDAVLAGLEIELPDHDYFQLLHQAKLRIAERDINEATKLLREAVELQPDAPQAYHMLGALSYKQEDFDTAEWELIEAARRTVRDASAETVMGGMFVYQDKYLDGIPWLKQALEKEPRYSPAHGWLAFSFYELQRFDEAMKHAREALKANPEDNVTMEILGGCLFETGDYKQAIQTYTDAISIQPESFHAHLGLAAAQSARYAESKDISFLDIGDELLEKARQLATDDADAKQVRTTAERFARTRRLIQANEAKASE